MILFFANRCRTKFYSIEELFEGVSRSFPHWITHNVFCAPSGGANLSSLLANIRWAWSLRDCDVIHQTGEIHYAVLGIWRSPVVLTIHDVRFTEEARGIKRLLFLSLWLYMPCLRADRVTVISEFTKERLLALCRVNPAKVSVIPNCVSPDFTPDAKPWPSIPPRILLVGTTPNKNLERVAEACRGLSLGLVVLGQLTGEQKALLISNELSFEEHHGLARPDVVNLYQGCDLVVFVSTYEGFGMPILEGQAVGRPVMTSSIAPMNAVARNGALLVDPFDVAAIRGGLVRLLGDAALREDLVRNGFENVKAYSARSVAAQYAALYREVVDAR